MTGAGTPLWDDLADRSLIAALSPGLPDGLDRRPDVLVVGGGVAGLCAAVMCRRAGIDRVVVLERGRRLATGPTGRAAGGLIPGVHALTQPASFAALASRGLVLHRELHPELLTGCAWRVGETVVPDQAVLDPLRLVAALAADAGTVATGVTVEALTAAPSVATSAGRFWPGAIVWATGVPPAGWVAPQPVKGHLVATGPVPFRIDAAVADDIVVLQHADGRLVAGGTFEPAVTDPSVNEAIVAGIERSLARHVPAAAGARITHRWTCFRPAVGGDLPVFGRLPGRDDAWAIAGLHRSGLLTAPAIGEVVARSIVSGSEELVDQKERRGGG